MIDPRDMKFDPVLGWMLPDNWIEHFLPAQKALKRAQETAAEPVEEWADKLAADLAKHSD